MSSYNHFGCSCCGGPFNGGNCPGCSSVGSKNEFVYDPNLNSNNDFPNFFNHPPQPQYETYSCELCRNDSHYGYDCPPRSQRHKEAANPSEPSPVSYFYNADYDNINTPSTTYTIHLTQSATITTNPSETTRRIYHNHDIFYDGDDDEEFFPDEVKRIQQILKKTSFDAITPDFLITNSLSMGDEHLSTILEMESDKFIKSSVENLVLNPSESKDLPKDLSNIISECNVPVGDDFTTVSNPLFDTDNEFSSSDDESSSDEDDNDSLMEEIDLFLTPDDSMPPGIENDDYDSEGDIIFLEELLSNDSLSLLENESFHFDVPSSHRPPAKPLDDGIYFDDETITGILTVKVVDDISERYDCLDFEDSCSWFCPSITRSSQPQLYLGNPIS
nr:hypothetical protein [Tanacetum cinerariifolium]